MVRLRRFAFAVVVVTAALAASRCYADKLKLGDPAPQWSKIPGVDGKEHSLSDYRDAKLVVIVFTCNHCPVAVAYEDRLVALQKGYQDKGVQLIAINVNNLPADRLDKMKERAQEKGFNFPYLYDSGQNTGREYGATNTPHVFVLDQNRKLVYRGGIDDNIQKPTAVKKAYLRDALDSLVADREPAQADTPHPGCGIKWDKK
jgi:peroxiredoxin